MSFSGNYNTSVFGRLKCVVLRRLKCVIFGRLKCIIFGSLKNFRDITILRFSGDWNLSFRENKLAVFERLKCSFFGGLKCNVFREMKKLNCPVSGKLNLSFSSAEITCIRRTENLNLKQKVNQSTPEVLPMLTGFVMRHNQSASYWTSYLWKFSQNSQKSQNFPDWFEKYFPLEKMFDSVTVS